MDYREAEEQFRELTGRYSEEEMSAEEYRSEIRKLQVEDEEGRLWMLQEMSGLWYVLQDGQWQPGQPPGRAEAGAVQKETPGKPPKKSSRKLLHGALIGVGVLSLCVIAGILIHFIYGSWVYLTGETETVLQMPGAGEAVEESSGVELAFMEKGSLEAVADGTQYTDEFGVSLVVPAEALEEPGERVRMIAEEVSGDLYVELQKSYRFETPVYQVGVDGELDGMGKAELSFPVEGGEAVLMVMIDEMNVALLEQQPENGLVRVHAHLGPLDAAEYDWGPYEEAQEEQGSIRYALLSPRKDAGRESNDQPGTSGGGLLASGILPFNLSSGQKEPDDCSAGVLVTGQEAHGWHGPQSETDRQCRTNPAKSVIVSWHKRTTYQRDAQTGARIGEGKVSGVEFTQAEAKALIDEAEKLVELYHEKGFVNARVETRWFGYALKIVVTSGGDPQYDLRNGTLYLPLDTARNLSSDNPSTEILHELAHWVQHKKYSFLRGLAGSRRWWLENSAELMTFMINPKSLDQNMSMYGKMPGFQKSINQWDEMLYIHAHQLWVGMCGNGAVCPLSEESFKAAINNGTYPLLDGGNQEKLLKNLDDYALYLLGSTPRQSNTAARTGVALGGSLEAHLGEMVNIGVNPNTNFNIVTVGETSQLEKITTPSNFPPVAYIKAKIEKGGVYPFSVASGTAWGNRTPLPAVLYITGTGTPFWMKLGDGDPVRYEGRGNYVIEPISDYWGHAMVSIVALGTGDSNEFKAEVRPMDLQGDWVIEEVQRISVSWSPDCDTLHGELDGMGMQEDKLSGYAERVNAHFVNLGEYRWDLDSGWEKGLVFVPHEQASMVEERQYSYSEEDAIISRMDFKVLYDSRINIEPQSIEWLMGFDMEVTNFEKASSKPVIQMVGFMQDDQGIHAGFLILVLFPGGVWLGIRGSSLRYKLIGLILLLASASLACITNMQAGVETKIGGKIESLRVIDGPPPDRSSPKYRLTGAEIRSGFEYVVRSPEITQDGEVKKEAEEFICTIENLLKGTVYIYDDGVIKGTDIFDEMFYNQQSTDYLE